MRRSNLWVAFVVCTMLTTGCGQQSGGSSATAAKGGLAVIDLDVVAKAVGRTREMNDALKLKQSSFDQALQRAKADFTKQIADKKAEFGETPTTEQQQQLVQMEQTANSQLLQGARKAQVALDEYRQQLVAEFRAEIKPTASQVAAEKGLGVVIPKNEGFLLAVDPGVDITADVIKAHQTARPAATAAAKPAAPAPTNAAQPMPPTTAAREEETSAN